MGTLGGVILYAVIVVTAGVIAYIGDRVGHQVGRKRLTIFGLRPKHTSTLVAVGTGMLIALVVTGSALLASNYARAAFFHLGEINNRVNELQAHADELDKRVHETNVVVNRGDLLYNQFLVISPTTSHAYQMKMLGQFLDAVVASLNRNLVPRGLKPYRLRAEDPDEQAKLEAFLADPKVQGFMLRGNVLLLAVADENLFVNDPIHFTFAPYADQLLFRAGQPIANFSIDGGAAVNPSVAYALSAGAVSDAAIASGMPSFFAQPIASVSQEQAQATADEIRRGHGTFYIVARAAQDIYPHTGSLPVTFTLSRTRS